MAVVNQYKFYGKTTTAAETVSMLSPSVNETYIVKSLSFWSDLNEISLIQAKGKLEKIDQRFENLKKIQNVFLNCYFKSIWSMSAKVKRSSYIAGTSLVFS